ncbi:MAG: hypothetical protein DMG15_06490 [Acidobacteria bacterium]|nr:MAG: hypothetical protein DMG16_13105 [Acidobacteriota bacterium]PYS14884.1 MAG: hypothetical protein DMG15_06490 [Acidobacteriota bacterium]
MAERRNTSLSLRSSIVTVPNAKTAASIDGLTPGTTYAIQVRAYGALGHTEWSDSATRMVI